MVYPVPPKTAMNYEQDEFEKLMISDFTGGLNITDPIVTLPANQFTAMLNFYYNRQRTIFARAPMRPAAFKTTTVDRPCIVDIAGVKYQPSAAHDYQVFRETLSNGWSYVDEVHVVSGIFSDITGAAGSDYCVVAVFNATSGTWIDIWSSTTVTSVAVVPYKVNQAFDLLIFPNNANPERWQPTATTGTLSDLGLTVPVATGGFTATCTVGTNPAGFSRITATTGYYKFSYVYDDKNVTTRFGESAATIVTDGDADGIAIGVDATNKGQVSIAFTDGGGTYQAPAGVTKVRVYRAPAGSVEGPYKYIGETDLTHASPDDTIATFIDSTPWGEEGIEDLQAGSNPSLSGSELNVLFARTVGPYIIGFDANITNKLIWCDSGKPDVWTPTNFDYLEHAGIIAIEFNRKIYAFTVNECYQKETMDTAAVKISNIGCIDGRSLQDVGNGLIWQDYDTVYFADFVTQYGSKGDFPKDIGHPVSRSVRRRSTTATTNSAFFERKYYLTYVDTGDFLQRTYVFDVDIGGWTEHSARHISWARGETTLYSFGKIVINKTITAIDGTVDAGSNALITATAHGLSNGDYVVISGTTNYNGTYAITWVSVDTFKIIDASTDAGETGSLLITKYYVYEHDYSATVSDSGESDYSGKDYHDYTQVAQTTYTGISTITTSIGRAGILLAGDFRKTFVSSMTVEANGFVLSILVTVSAINDDFSTSKTFASGSTPEVIPTYEFIFDEGVFAADPDIGAAGDADEAGFAGLSSSSAAQPAITLHKKFNRIIKSNSIGITLTSTDSRGHSILYIVLYWKPLAAVA